MRRLTDGNIVNLVEDDAGASALELAILLPVLLAIILGICEFGRALWTVTTLQSAVEAAARCAAINVANCTPDVPTFAANRTGAIGARPNEFQYTANQSCGATGHTTGALVSVSHVFTPLVPALIPGLPITLTAKSCHP